jgi:hypothetical protein
MSERHKALAAIIVCVLFWGFSFISIKVVGAVFPPMSQGFLRFAIAMIFLYFIKRKLAPNEKLRKRDIPLLLGAGLSGVTLYFFCENNGVALVTASEASIAVGAIPVLTMIADWLGGKITRNKNSGFPRLGARQWLGAFISIGGVWLVAGVSIAISGSILGYIYMAGTALCWVAYSFLTRPPLCPLFPHLHCVLAIRGRFYLLYSLYVFRTRPVGNAGCARDSPSGFSGRLLFRVGLLALRPLPRSPGNISHRDLHQPDPGHHRYRRLFRHARSPNALPMARRRPGHRRRLPFNAGNKTPPQALNLTRRPHSILLLQQKQIFLYMNLAII